MFQAGLKSGIKVFICSIFLGFLIPAYAAPSVESGTRETGLINQPGAIEQKLMRKPRVTKPTLETPQPQATPETNEEKFLVKKIKLEGCESIPEENFKSDIARYENKKIGFSDLEKLAKEIEEDYLKAGLVAAVFVPEQEIKKGTVTLQVVESKMGKLIMEGDQKYFSNDRLRYYWEIPRGETLRYDRLSKSLQLANRNPDREVKAALKAGEKAGTTDVILTSKENFPLHITGSFDNEGVTQSGKSRTGSGIRDNNLLGLDDILMAGYTSGTNFGGYYAYHKIPVSPNGTYLLYGVSSNGSSPKKEFTPFGIKSHQNSGSVSVHQELYDKDTYLGEVSSGFTAQDKITKLSGKKINQDRLRIVNLQGNFTHQGFGTTTTIAPELQQGLHIFNATGNNNPIATRHAKSDFTIFGLSATHRMALPLDLQANLKFNGQIASTRLASQNAFSMGGIDSIRGYPAGDFLADNAVTSSAELLIPAFFVPRSWQLPYNDNTLKSETTLVAFADYGHGQHRGPAAGDIKSVDDLGLGAGIRIRVFNQALLRMEWGWPMADRPITQGGKSHFHFAVEFQDMLPEEIERIAKEREEMLINQLAWQLLDKEANIPDSLIARSVNMDLFMANWSYQHGRIQDAKEIYEDLVIRGNSLYQQSQSYIEDYFSRIKEFKDARALALQRYKEGKFYEAKVLWEKIIADSKIEPLTLEF